MSQLLDIHYILKNDTNLAVPQENYIGKILVEESFFEGIVQYKEEEFFIFGKFDLENSIEFVQSIPEVSFSYILHGEKNGDHYDGEYFVQMPYWKRTAGDVTTIIGEEMSENHPFEIEKMKERLVSHREQLNKGCSQLYYLFKQQSIETHVYRKGYFKK